MKIFNSNMFSMVRMEKKKQMLTYSFSDIGPVPLYQHLYKCLKNDILQGILHAGEKLPSKRSFAKNLGISVITVETAYEQLIAEGYIYSIPKKGFFVNDVNTPVVEPHLPPVVEKTPVTPEKVQYIADFTSNQTTSERFPFSIWAKIMRGLLKDNQPELLTNSPSGGIYELRNAIAQHLYSFRGMSVRPEQIVVGAGTEYLYGLLIQLLGKDKRYGIENPGYHKLHKIYQSYGVPCNYISMDSQGIQIADLEKKDIDIVHISPSHHFPTGIVTPVSRRYELLGWAARSDKHYIIEDDYDSEFRLSGKPIPTLQSIDASEKVIYMNTFTKTLASTVRISYMILPEHLVEKFYSQLAFYSCTVSNFEQYTLARFISEGYFEKHLNRMRNYYHEKRDHLLSIIEKNPKSRYVTISEEDAGLHFLIKLNTRLSDSEFCRRMEKKGIKISSLSQYYAEPEEEIEHTFIINYSYLDEQQMEDAIELLLGESGENLSG